MPENRQDDKYHISTLWMDYFVIFNAMAFYLKANGNFMPARENEIQFVFIYL